MSPWGEVKAGIAIDETAIANSTDLYRILNRHQVGDTIVVTVLRDEGKVVRDYVLEEGEGSFLVRLP